MNVARKPLGFRAVVRQGMPPLPPCPGIQYIDAEPVWVTGLRPPRLAAQLEDDQQRYGGQAHGAAEHKHDAAWSLMARDHRDFQRGGYCSSVVRRLRLRNVGGPSLKVCIFSANSDVAGSSLFFIAAS